tara:strand:+ start:46 stop:234 length:189 start_codon:yes stop_codon:yes gene_type:complete
MLSIMQSIDYELPLPKCIHSKDLRKFIISAISKKGAIIRWSIYDIVITGNKKILKINALVLN